MICHLYPLKSITDSLEDNNIKINGVIKLINDFNQQKASGPDKIQHTIFDGNIRNNPRFSLNTPSVNTPTINTRYMREAYISSHYKAGNRDGKDENYRPISLMLVHVKF